MQAKIIKTETEYDQALFRIDELMDAVPDTDEGNELELLVTLVEFYEEKKYAIDLPDAVSAIKFRMEQQGLKQKDLIPFIGSKSKVSEVLSEQRPLSLSMIRKLHAGLGIPADVLMQEPEARLPEIPDGLEWKEFPLAEMLKRKWLSFEGKLSEAKEHVEELLSNWAAPLRHNALQPALLRQHMRGRKSSSVYSLAAWRIQVSLQAQKQTVSTFKPGTIDAEFMRDLVKLSYFDNGPLLAKEFLLKNGIHFIVEPHLKGTHLDGAVMFLPNRSPLVALTLRYDRLDNFWFTLCHELAHLALHLGKDDWELFYDDLDCNDKNDIESKADAWATDALIPAAKWHDFKAIDHCTAVTIKDFAEKLRIHPAILAGRVRREQSDYSLFTKLLGNGTIRHLFSVTS